MADEGTKGAAYGLLLISPTGERSSDGRVFSTHHEAWCAGKRWVRRQPPGANFMVQW